MRIRFTSYLTMGIVSAFLVVASYGFVASTYMWLAFAGGIVLALLGCVEVAVSRRKATLAAPAALVTVLGIVMAVVAVVLSLSTVADTAFALAIATGALSALGLAGHELDVEHDIDRHAMPRPGAPALN
jgi:peptidoglycan/LPS O-acetylase OafA/YrhL